MRRLTTGLCALILFAAACGSSDDAEDVIAGLGLSEAETACFEAEFEARGLNMTEMLTADRDDLSSDEAQTVLDIASTCNDGGVNRSDAEADEAPETADASDEAADDDSTGETDDDSDESASTTDDDSTGETGDESSGGQGRDYDDLTTFEQAFVDGLVQSGGTVEVGICMLDEFEAAGISMLDLAELGLDEDAQPTGDIMAAIFRCGEELAESGVFDGDSFFGLGEEGDTYGDNAELDVLWDACAAGELSSCDDLYYSSAFGSEYESFGSTCGQTDAERFGSCASGLDTTPTPEGYGDDVALDALWDACAAGELSSCDTLFFEAPFGSTYESYGSTCGETTTEQFGTCAGFSDTTAPSVEGYGDDAQLDALWDSCAAGDLASCDDLWFSSPIGSAYEAYAESCGGLSTEALWGSCEETLG